MQTIFIYNKTSSIYFKIIPLKDAKNLKDENGETIYEFRNGFPNGVTSLIMQFAGLEGLIPIVE